MGTNYELSRGQMHLPLEKDSAFYANTYRSEAMIHQYHGQKTPFDKLTDAIAPNAFHDSATRFDPPKCHPRTRVKIVDDVMGWILGQGVDTAVKPFLWLNGVAGAGKSAIAQSTIDRCMELRGTEMLSAISKEPLIFTKQLQQQFTTLVVQPLKTYLSRRKFPESQTSFIIVIDGLDECIDRTSLTSILSCLADSVRDLSSYIRILVASRPEYDITLSFDSKHLKAIHTRLSLGLERVSDVESDIKLYLSDQFEHIKDDCNSSPSFWPKLDWPWPGEDIIQELVSKSSGQFIYAATFIRYITSARPQRPDRRLDMVLELRPHDGDLPFAELDALYEKILESSKDIEKVLEVLSLKIMDLDLDWSTFLYENVLSYEEGEVGRLFCDLGALDYLQDKARSKQFHIDLRGKYIGRHMGNVLKYLASSGPEGCFDSLNWDSSYAVTFFMDHSSKLRWCTIPPELPQAAFSFPLEGFLTPLFLSESVDVPYLAWQFVFKYLHVLRIIALKDPTCSYIEDHQHRKLDTVMIHPLQRYFDEEVLALVLALTHHLGSHRFVPLFTSDSTLLGHYSDNVQEIFPSPYDINDHLGLINILSFSAIKGEPVPVLMVHESRAFYEYIHRFLTSVVALNPAIYAKAVNVCFDFLETLPLPSSAWEHNAITSNTEDDLCPDLAFEDMYYAGPWVHRGPWSRWSLRGCRSVGYTISRWFMEEHDDDSERDPESTRIMYFTVLGYIIFFLPGCGRSDDLIAACIKQQRSYIENRNNPFPIRWRRLHMEVNNYLARV
ncbi:hypothetical protein D9613_008185 [Agrocybe pediades]|uniref:Nephrocystin 3-like N-terminal domain-containing protein n=1 Tax=Agrocybe pediades TaxID=84607 RepID=A0A8H4QMG7_9AGAR|nr:hypothetical protein D9613_008185 [Agrocybe pediades]